MRRRFPEEPLTALERFETMARAGAGLEMLRARLGEGASLSDARRFRERVKQSGRRPCSFLDRDLGIDRA